MRQIGDVSYETFGYILHVTSRLQHMASRLPGKLCPLSLQASVFTHTVIVGREKAWFEDDLREIESDQTDTAQKLAIIQRMYHTYAFLNPNSAA